MVVAGDRLGERPGQKEKLKLGIKKAQNGIKIKSISTTTSAGSKKKLVFWLTEINFQMDPQRTKKKEAKLSET